MGIVLNQSLKKNNTTILVLLSYKYNLFISFFSWCNVLQLTMCFRLKYYYAVVGFGMQNTLVKFYSQCKTEQEQSQFSFTVLFPLLLSIPLILIGMFFYPSISAFLSRENPIVKDYLWLIPFTGLCMAYFEIFYAWARVNMHSVLKFY
jgi:hypothetical protein